MLRYLVSVLIAFSASWASSQTQDPKTELRIDQVDGAGIDITLRAIPDAVSEDKNVPTSPDNDLSIIRIRRRTDYSVVIEEVMRRDAESGSVDNTPYTWTIVYEPEGDSGAVNNPLTIATISRKGTDPEQRGLYITEPTADFFKAIDAGTDQFAEAADKKVTELKNGLGPFRFVLNGSVVGLTFWYNYPEYLLAAAAAGTTMGLISWGLQRNEAAYARVLEGPATRTWDRDGLLRTSGQLRWKLAYDVWKTLRHTVIIAAFLAAVKVTHSGVIAVQETSPEMLTPNLFHLYKIFSTAFLSALSFGQIKRNQTEWTVGKLRRNLVQNFANRAEGYQRAEEITRTTYWRAFQISIVSVLFEAMSVGNRYESISSSVMGIVALSGWGYHAWHYLGVKHSKFVLKGKQLGAKAKETLCSWFFSDPIQPTEL